MVNKVTLIGNLGADPELRTTNGGMQIANLRVATSHRAKGSDGNYEDVTEWHRVTVFDKAAEFAGKYLKKGRTVYVDGRIQTRKYTDAQGVEKYSTEVVCNELKAVGPNPEGQGQGSAHAHTPPTPRNTGRSEPSPASDDDIPF